MAEGRGKAQADALRRARHEVRAKKFARSRSPRWTKRFSIVKLCSNAARWPSCPAPTFAQGDVVLVEAGDYIPVDGEVIEGIASVDESAITGESAPVIRESGGDRSGVTGGTRVLVRLAHRPRHGQPRRDFLGPHDRHGRRGQTAKNAQRNRPGHPPGRHDDHLSAWFASPCCRFRCLACEAAGRGTPITVTVLVALLVCLIPTTIGGLLSAIGIAGMDRMIQTNVIAMSGRAVEAAGDVDVLLLGQDRHDHAGQPAGGRVSAGRRRVESPTWPMPRSWPRWPTKRRKDAASWCWPRPSTDCGAATSRNFMPRSSPLAPKPAISGVELRRAAYPQRGRRRHRRLRPRPSRRNSPPTSSAHVERIAKQGGTPLVVAEGDKAAGRHPPEGHRQGRHAGTFRPDAADGHSDRDDHRRQSADGRRHRRRGGRRRFSGPGHPRGEARR